MLLRLHASFTILLQRGVYNYNPYNIIVCSSHPLLGPQSLYAPHIFFFPRQRDFFIPARYPRGLDSLTLRGQKKEEGGGEKKGAERDRGRERRKNLPRPFVVGAEVLFAVETTSKTVQG